VRAQQNDRIFRRAVQNLHIQIIEIAGEHAHTRDEACEALEKMPTKDIDRAQSAPQKALVRIFFLAAKALLSILNHEEHGAQPQLRVSLRECYMAVLAARLPMPDEHAPRMLAASLWCISPGCPRVAFGPLLLAT
jgi:hypothetical protein